MPLLLVVDDEPNIVYTIEETLGSDKLQIATAGTAREGIELVRHRRPDVVLLDVRLPDMSGLDAFQQMHQIDPRLPVIIMTAFAKTDTAIEAMRRGAFDYFVKPVDLVTLRETVNRALNVSRLSHVPALLGEDADTQSGDAMVGQSAPMQEVYKTIGRVAQQDVTVLIVGESGTGKELAARAIYHYSRRASQPFLAVNCAALPESLLESELFGHEKGAFTGADQRRIGKFEQVNGGTIFLDEIGDMSPSTQAKALRLLQQQQFERVGGNTTIETNVRIIAATNKDLPTMAAEGGFRQDLFYRLSGFTLRMPPLRDRLDDVPLLTDYLVKSLSLELDKPIHGIADEAKALLQKHSWPGNVREIRNAIRYAIVQSTTGVITEQCLPQSCRPGDETSDGMTLLDSSAEPLPEVRAVVRQLLAGGSRDIYREVTQMVEHAMLGEVLDDTGGNLLHASERLGISRVTLRAKLKQSKGA